MTIKIYNHELAKSIGDRPAILYAYIERRYVQLETFRKQKDWFGHSIQQFADEFPYYSLNTIKRILKFLKEKNLIWVREGNYLSKCANSYKPNITLAQNLSENATTQNGLPLGQNGSKVGSKWVQGRLKMGPRSAQNGSPTISNKNQTKIIQDRARETAPFENINIEDLPEDMREQVRALLEGQNDYA